MPEYLSVSVLSRYLKAKFDKDPYLERVYLTGQISNFRARPNHQYFSLKDGQAKISATLWAKTYQQLDFQLEEGMQVLVIGRIALYEPQGSYSIIIEKLVPDGKGALTLQHEALKKKLTQEGLFDSERKKALPAFAWNIGVVTSPSGAVIEDIITTVNRRFPVAKIHLFPAKVQGDGAVTEIVSRIRQANQTKSLDLLIIGRGGGSSEDLWAFNEEPVIRAIAASELPIISSVGHEADVTLADFASDQRAATPTAAAEIATPRPQKELLELVSRRQSQLERYVSNLIKRLTEKVSQLQNSTTFRQPSRLYEGHKRLVDELDRRLKWSYSSEFSNKKRRTRSGYQNLLAVYQKIIERRSHQVESAYNKLLLLDLTQVQARGFILVKKETHYVKSVKEIKQGDQLTLQFKDGEVDVNAN